MLRLRTPLAIAFSLLLAWPAAAIENIGSSGKTATYYKSQAASCDAASSQVDLDINNVRTTLMNGGDLWWNLNDARYEIPKIDPPGSAPSVHALFAGAIWLGGIDAGGQLKLAAQTYRQSGNDFWPGPLDDFASVTEAVCRRYDRHWLVTAADIEIFRATVLENGLPLSTAQVPPGVLEWPGKGNVNSKDANNNILVTTDDLAPFYDANDNGIYDPATGGDFPIINSDCGEIVYADEMIFWVYNDQGNIHTETGGQPIGVQVNALAFAFSTSDEVNNMTFYRYKLINKATLQINDFYMGQWVDPDLGCYTNDYVGCDTARSLGICYNGTSTDPDCATSGYGTNPPLVGVDYFEGPQADKNDGIDNDGDGLIDEGSDGIDNDGDGEIDEVDEQEKLGMSTFVYYNNDFTVTGNPEAAVHFYNYLRGFWKDGLHVTFGGTGYGGTIETQYMFASEPNASGANDWSECSNGNVPADRRFIQSSGPFTLAPGAINYITVGVVWVRPVGFSCGASTFASTIGQASDKAQALFDNCFKLVDGPDAPTLQIREMDKELTITLVNLELSNNFNETYNEKDPIAAALAETDPTIKDSTYTFQGYKLYQLKNASVSAAELNDVSLARLVAQVDIEDGVSKIVNFEFDPLLGADVPTLQVDGKNEGIRHSFNIKEDFFATAARNLVNHKTYYYAAVAYAYNNYKDYDQAAEDKGQNRPYLQGRRNFRVYSAIPHIPISERGGTMLNSAYGDGVEVTRLDGTGNGGLNLDLVPESVTDIITNAEYKYGPIVYEPRMGPIDVMVYDPFEVKNVDFTLAFAALDTFIDQIVPADTSWVLYVEHDGSVMDTIFSDKNIIDRYNEQLIEDYGISITIKQVGLPGHGAVPDNPVTDTSFPGFIEANGFIEATMEFEDPENAWLTGLRDEGTFGFHNWIRAGAYVGSEDDPDEGFWDDHKYSVSNPDPGRPDIIRHWDPNEIYGDVLDGTWAPYCLAANWRNNNVDAVYSYGPAFYWRYRRNFTLTAQFRLPTNNMQFLPSVDVVLTPDKDLWTRAVVVETGEDEVLSEGGAKKGQIRMHLSVDKDGLVEPGDTGRSWFPGYAINVETGERLNIMFGEDSWLAGENGRDMIWNPTSNVEGPQQFSPQVLVGGKHYVYIMGTKYDEGAATQRAMLDNFNTDSVINGGGANALVFLPLNDLVYKKIMWVSMALLSPGYELLPIEEGLIPSETKIRLRVNRPYAHYFGDGTNDSLPKYFFSTDGMAADTGLTALAKNALDLIKVVPNPYYAYSAYETSQLDNRVKITNLPADCVVSIFDLNGTLIRRFDRSVSGMTSEGNTTDRVNLDNALDWDLKNNKNIAISSGIYLIHVQADGLGERVIKWFGALRPLDLDTF